MSLRAELLIYLFHAFIGACTKILTIRQKQIKKTQILTTLFFCKSDKGHTYVGNIHVVFTRYDDIGSVWGSTWILQM